MRKNIAIISPKMKYKIINKTYIVEKIDDNTYKSLTKNDVIVVIIDRIKNNNITNPPTWKVYTEYSKFDFDMVSPLKS